jgi:hypothetical protein
MNPRKKPAGKGKRRESPSGQNEVVLSDVVPGQQLERAAADITREAGLSIVGGLKRLYGVWIAGKEAKAKAARMAIETDASIDRGRKITTERRQQELEEFQHEEDKALARQHLKRLLIEMARQEENFEAITAQSLKQIEHDPAGDKGRKIEDDWLFKFARYAQDVSNSKIQELWARILASAAIEGKQRVSAAALQAMSLLDSRSAKDLEKFFRVYVTFGCCPIPLDYQTLQTMLQTHPMPYDAYQKDPQAINLRTLQELGLIETRTLKQYSFPEFDLSLYSMGFTQRGDEIVNAVFQQQTDKQLGDELEMKYLKIMISQFPRPIFPKIKGKRVDFMIQIEKLTKRTGPPLPGIKVKADILEQLPDQLRRLIKWADKNYVISYAPNPDYRA